MSGAGLSTALLVTAAAYLLVTLLPATDPMWREMNRRPADRPADLSAGTPGPPR